MSSRNQPVEIKDVMIKLGGGILFLLFSTFLIEVILEIDMTNQCRLHYNDNVGSVTSIFGIVVEGERKLLECIQYNEFVSVVKDPKDKDKIIGRTFTVTNTCIGGPCTTVVGTFSWTEDKDERNTPGPHCKDDKPPKNVSVGIGDTTDTTCGGKKLYHAQDKPIPMMLFGLNAFLLVVGMLVFIMAGYKLMLYVKRAPE